MTTSPSGFRATSAYDSHRDRVVLADETGGTFEHDGNAWRPIGGLPRTYFAPQLAYQAHRGRTLALVRNVNSFEFETYEYDGHSWRSRAPDHTPLMRHDAAMAYDAQRRRVVLFGGTGGTRLDDTWEWDGSDWLRRLPATKPAARDHAAMAYDSTRGIIMMFGGRDATSFLGDHWEWDGTNWLQHTPAVLPSARSRGKLAHDAARNRTVLYGGVHVVGGLNVFVSQPWEYDGQQWLQPVVASVPSGRGEHTMVAVQSGVRIFGGSNAAVNAGINQHPEIFDYDGTQFTPRHGPIVHGLAMAFDAQRGRTVILGWDLFPQLTGANRTFEWDGSAITEVVVAAPTPPSYLSLSDDLNGSVIGFGGIDGATVRGDTWAFNGSQWTQVASSGPSPRYGASIATDRARGVVVMFGGADAQNSALQDTWEWNGSAWSQQLVTGPAARIAAPMAFDPILGECILHGGFDSISNAFPDTWAYSASGWTMLSNTGPTGSFLAYSPEMATVLMTGNDMFGNAAVETHALFQGAWFPIFGGAKSDRIHAMATDPDGHVIGLGGASALAVSLFTTTPHVVQKDGPGCSFVTPHSRMILRDPPRPGNALRLESIGGEPAQIALFAISFGFSFVPIGVCASVLAQPIVLGVTMTNSVGQAMVPLFVPNTPAAIGLQFWSQAAIGETAGPIGGVLGLTDALRIVIGD